MKQYYNKDGQPAPSHYDIDGKQVFTTDEKIHNEQGYYERVYTDYPNDDKLYDSTFELQGNKLVQVWIERSEDNGEAI